MDRATKLLQDLIRAAKNLNLTLLVPIFLLPLFLVVWVLQEKNGTTQMLAQQTANLEKKAVFLKKQKAKQDKAWELAQKSDPRYLSQAVESLSLLAPELHRVQALTRQYPENRALQERLSFLQGEKNRIKFVQQTERAAPTFHETELKLQNPVQMNDDDLRKFLVAVEGDDYSANEERPLFVIKEFELMKQREKADETVYNIQVEMIKRAP
jgi:hypothetical protein